MEVPNSTATLQGLEGVQTTVILLDCPTISDVMYDSFSSGQVIAIPWDLGNPNTYKRLRGRIGVVALERPLLPLSGMRTLENILTRTSMFESTVLLKMAVTIQPGWAIMTMLKQDEQFEEEYKTLEDLEQLGSSVDIFENIAKKYARLIRNAGATIVPFFHQQGSLTHSGIRGKLYSKLHPEFGDMEQTTLVITCLLSASVRSNQTPREFTTRYTDQLTFERMNERLYTDTQTAKIICHHVKDTLHHDATGPYFSDALSKFRDGELALCSKIGSILINRPEKEFSDLVAYGEERAGKTPVLPIVILAACSPPVAESYAQAGCIVRIIVFTGPNTLAPEVDIETKFKRDLSRIATATPISSIKESVQIETILSMKTSDVLIFGDSVGRVKRFQRLLKEPRLQHVRWILALDESDHLFGRGYGRGYSFRGTDGEQRNKAEAETVLRKCSAHPNIVGRFHITATPIPLYFVGRDHVLPSGTNKIHTTILREPENYHGFKSLDVKYKMQKGDEIHKLPRNSIHHLVDDFWDMPETIPFESDYNRGFIHPVLLLILTTYIKPKNGNLEIAENMSKGMYSTGRHNPICLVFAEAVPTIWVDGIPQLASKFLEEFFRYDPEIFPENNKRAATSLKSSANHLQTLIPRIFRHYGLQKRLVILGFNKLARGLTVACRTKLHDNYDRLFYISHVAYKVGRTSGLEYRRCIEDIRQIIARSLNNSYDISVNDAYQAQLDRDFEVVVCTDEKVKSDIVANVKQSRIITEWLGILHDINATHRVLKGKVCLDNLEGTTVRSTKRKHPLYGEGGKLSDLMRPHPPIAPFSQDVEDIRMHLKEVLR